MCSCLLNRKPPCKTHEITNHWARSIHFGYLSSSSQQLNGAFSISVIFIFYTWLFRDLLQYFVASLLWRASLFNATITSITMILGPINGVDCVAFVIFLIPQLIYQVAVGDLLLLAVRIIPFLSL